MKILKHEFYPQTSQILIKELLCRFFNVSHSLHDFIFFDIETTGLSANSSMCWLIGTLSFNTDKLTLTQYFAASPSDEKDLLEQFFNTLTHSSCLVHFNGSVFDIPFLLERAELLQCSPENVNTFKACNNLDILKISKSCRSLLNLANYKQKTIEKFLDFPRKDVIDGKKLISLYKKYIISKDTSAQDLLLQHNMDDLCGLYEICTVCAYRQLYEGTFKYIQTEINTAFEFDGTPISEMIFNIQTEFPFPKEINYKSKDSYFKIFNNHINLCVPIKNNRIQLFFTDYKNYFYLPESDCAIHKSVASYVDKTRRIPATKDNCYAWTDFHTLKSAADIQRFTSAYIWHMLM